jgi:hypothetical protein
VIAEGLVTYVVLCYAVNFAQLIRDIWKGRLTGRRWSSRSRDRWVWFYIMLFSPLTAPLLLAAFFSEMRIR